MKLLFLALQRRNHHRFVSLLVCVWLASFSVFAQPTRARAEEPQFDLLAFNVLGNTVLSAPEIERAIYPFLGPGRTLADAEAARAALERAYQSRGFLSVIVVLPPQRLKDDELLLEVVEAQVSQRQITGSRYHLPSVLAEKVPSLAPGVVPNFETMQTELARAQGSGDVQITPVITPGVDPRQLGIELKVQDKLPLHGQIELNSKQSYNTERGRLEAGLRYDNLFQRQHSIGLNWIYSPTAPSQANTLVASYGLPMPWGSAPDAGRLSLSFVNSDSQTPSSLGGATVVRGTTAGARFRKPLEARDNALSHAWTVGVDFKDNRDSSRDATGVSTPNAGLRYPAFHLGYDQYIQHNEAEYTRWDIGLGLGFAATGARTVDCNGRPLDQFECKRASALPTYQVLRGSVQHQEALPARWGLNLQLQWQLAPHALASGEQFGAGGVDSVRGYHEFEQVGDSGAVLRAEVSSPAWRPWSEGSLQGVVFAEGAALRVNEPLAAERQRIRMASAGLGLRLRAPYGLQARLDWAVPLLATLKADTTGTLVPASGSASRNEQRWDLSVRHEF